MKYPTALIIFRKRTRGSDEKALKEKGPRKRRQKEKAITIK